jgi:hypothetical protein
MSIHRMSTTKLFASCRAHRVRAPQKPVQPQSLLAAAQLPAALLPPALASL